MSKNILITGSSSGIGEGLASHYLQQNHNVYGISRRVPEKLNGQAGYNHLQLDLSQFKEIEKQLPAFLSNASQFDLVILNAGILTEIRDLKDTPIDEIKKVMDINVWSNKILIDTLVNTTENIKQVVAISSGASVSGSRGWNAYSLSKAALNMLVSLYAGELPNTHFIALAPGIIDTNMQEYISSLPDDDRYPVVATLKNAKGTDMMPTPDQIAPKLAKAMANALNFESGKFIDVRNL